MEHTTEESIEHIIKLNHTEFTQLIDNMQKTFNMIDALYEISEGNGSLLPHGVDDWMQKEGKELLEFMTTLSPIEVISDNVINRNVSAAQRFV